MKITKEVIDTASAHFLSLDEMAYLWDIYFQEDWNIPLNPASINKMTKFGILDSKGNVTNAGESIIMLVIDIPEVEESSEDNVIAFEEFWKLYPRDDAYNVFSKSRQLRWNKTETRKAFLELCKEYTSTDIIKSLQNEINFRKSPSKENLFKYMYNSVNWFKKNGYENFLGDDEDGETLNEYGKEVS